MISDYATLQTRIANWAARASDASFVAEVPTFIQLAEQTMFMDLRVREGMCEARADLNEEYEWLPAGFLEKDHVNILDLSDAPLATAEIQKHTPIDFQDNKEFLRYDAGTGRPCNYTIVGERIRFRPYPTVESGENSRYAYELVYYGEWTPLSDAATTNGILTKYPQLYLFASMIHAEAFLVNDQRVATWTGRYDKAVADANRRSELAVQGGTMAVGMPS